MNSPTLKAIVANEPIVDPALTPGAEAPRPSTVVPPKFAAWRGGGLEPLYAETEEEALATMRKQIHLGKGNAYLFCLTKGVFYEPSSVVIDAKDIAERLSNTTSL